MSNLDVIRAWKDEQYRAGLRNSEIVRLPANSAGTVALPLEDLVAAGTGETELTYPGMCSCIGICPFTIDLLCGSTMEFFACTVLACPPWIV